MERGGIASSEREYLMDADLWSSIDRFKKVEVGNRLYSPIIGKVVFFLEKMEITVQNPPHQEEQK